MTDQVEISLWLIDDEKEMAKLNNKYRGIDDSTDVLSFPQFDENEIIDVKKGNFLEGNYSNEENIPLGDVIISITKMREQAKNYNHTEERELAFLYLHGLLHLLGYDHASDIDEKGMFEKQERILNKLGINR
ncbi:Endoribonuclease YbeY [Natranaerofaba carboxydovora]|nr:Endoribonuclease YbeY [Natranaerofaba carboxydovora]